MQNVCVFLGSKHGGKSAYLDATRAVGREIARQKCRLIYGGGSIGLMGELADATLSQGGSVIGVITRGLKEKEVAQENLETMHVVETLAERKTKMLALADSVVTLPGGVGTLDELFEVWSWTRLHLYDKPFGLLNVEGYFDALLQQMDRMCDDGFIEPIYRDALVVDDDERRLLDRLRERCGVSAELIA